MLNKARKYLTEMKLEKDMVEAMVYIHTTMVPQVPSVAWQELFEGLDYSYLLEKAAEKLVRDFSDEELNKLLEFSKQSAYHKVLRSREENDLEADQESEEWMLSIKDKFLSRTEYVFKKHKVEGRIQKSFIRGILSIEGDEE